MTVATMHTQANFEFAGATAVHLACEGSNVPIVRLLKDAGADMAAADNFLVCALGLDCMCILFYSGHVNTRPNSVSRLTVLQVAV